MSLFSRAHDIVAAKANKALDSAENPDEMLDYSYEQMLDHITQVRRALVDITASKKQLELQEQQLQQSIDHLNDQAKAALAAGRERAVRLGNRVRGSVAARRTGCPCGRHSAREATPSLGLRPQSARSRPA